MTMKQVFLVYRLRTLGMGTNAYGVARDEQWRFEKDKKFDDPNEAQQYIIEQSRLHTELPRFLVDVSDVDKNDFIWQFCFSNDVYLKYRRFFLGKPPVLQMEKALKTDGIQVVHYMDRGRGSGGGGSTISCSSSSSVSSVSSVSSPSSGSTMA
jgi:hypothetical protein